MQICSVIEGFPDNSEDDVLAAISELKDLGFVRISSADADGNGMISPAATVTLNKQKEREAILVVFPNMHSHDTIEDQDSNTSSITDKKKWNSVMAISSRQLPLIIASIFAASLIITVVYAAANGVLFFSDRGRGTSSYDYYHTAAQNYEGRHEVPILHHPT